MKVSGEKLENQKHQKRVLTIICTAFFAVLCAIVLVPFLAMFFASFRPGQELVRYGLNLHIDLQAMTFQNYVYLFTGEHNYFIWFRNSIVLTALTVVLTLLVCYFVAYGLAMYRFRLNGLLFFLVLATMMVPFEILMLPLYQQAIDLKLINTMAGVILPGLCSASTIFFFRQYMMGLPKELLDAGRIDGANEYRISTTIMMPLVKPAFAAMSILCGMTAWNNMLWPLLVFREERKFTLPIGLNTLLTPYGNNYDLLIVGSVFSIVPIFILFLFFQRYFISGMTSGAVKG